MQKEELTTGNWLNLATTFSLVVDKKYRFQNIGAQKITIVFSQTEPPAGDIGFVYEASTPIDSETIVYDGVEPIWARALITKSQIVIHEVIV